LGSLSAAAVALLVILIAAGNSGSLPGTPLYTLKRASEGLEGLIRRAAGEEAAWQAEQVTRRLDEALALEAQGKPVSDELLAEIDESMAAAMAAVNELPPSERARFLVEWMQQLSLLWSDAPPTGEAAAALEEVNAMVYAALDMARTPPTPTPLIPTSTPTETPSATATVTAAADLVVMEEPPVETPDGTTAETPTERPAEIPTKRPAETRVEMPIARSEERRAGKNARKDG